MNLAPLFNAQFIDDDGTPLAGGWLYTYATGTVTPQTTYQDQAGGAENENPIELDAAGRCDLWLDPALEYTLLLKRADLTTVRTWDDVGGAQSSALGVTSVNGEAGVVVLTSEDIEFTTSTDTTWFVGVDVQAALDSIIERVDGEIPASAIPIIDAGSLLTATNVEDALQELAGVSGVADQSGNSGKFLTTNGTATSWGLPAAAVISIADAGGVIAATTVEGALQEVALAVAAVNLPPQTGNAGKFLSTDGTSPSWATAGTGSSTQAATGTTTLPGGLIFKWGKAATIATDAVGTAVTFAVAFPNNAFQVIASAATGNGTSGGTGEKYSVSAYGLTTSGFSIDNDGNSAVEVAWWAIGN